MHEKTPDWSWIAESAAALSADSIPHLSLGTSILVVFLICLAFVMARGLARMIFATILLAASGCAGLLTWHHTPAFCHHFFDRQVTAILIALPVAAFACTWLFLFKAFHLILSPFGHFSTGDRPRGSLATSMLAALVPTTVFLALAAGLLHHFGSVEELRSFVSGKDPTNRIGTFLQSAKSSLETILPAPLMRKLDPMTSPELTGTAKFIAKRAHHNPKPVIDPETGQPYPRAILVDDPQLLSLAREGKFGTLLRHPVLIKASKDPRVRKLLSLPDSG